MSSWHKCQVGTNVMVGEMTGGTNVVVAQMSHFVIGGTNVTFLVIGGTNVTFLVIGGTNARWDCGTYDKGTKVAASIIRPKIFIFIFIYFYFYDLIVSNDVFFALLFVCF
jgi:hypothetical protein